MIVYENLWVRQFTHRCILIMQWAHEDEPRVQWERIRMVDDGYLGESGYRYGKDGWAIMDTPRDVYRRLLAIDLGIKPLVRVRLPRERVRL